MDRKLLEELRDLAGRATPLAGDCGQYCDHACCYSDEDGLGGVYLFPGEEVFYENADWCRIEDTQMMGKPARIMYCLGPCPRDNRPLGCRIFPLTPHFNDEGELKIRMDCRARPLCPLVANGKKGLVRDFVKGVEAAMQKAASDDEGCEFLHRWSELEKQFDFRL